MSKTLTFRVSDIALDASQVTFGISWTTLIGLDVLPPQLLVTNGLVTLLLWYIASKYWRTA
ncbi:hypothetical protein LRY65_04995 [Candidatus Woesebacteria bacterium]|nr:hypothetical protein [Candidatus Woesebacteria bacterium]MCD8506854.1 hypothetical protein [Candidatus Woesebacteria bacterium]MCD8527526.1 hypothetical protein [Candidatus Woesebacteria bacterium]MCD8546266.1 hypothetical protein [Candidatus Woesebacteria bacterium]